MKKTFHAAAVFLGVALASSSLLASGGESERGEGAARRGATHTAWQAECGSCHLAYPPRFLPAQSWRRIVSSLDKHFGSNASLEPAALREITDFLVNNSAQPAASKPAAFESAAADATLPRISDTGWFRRAHEEIGPEVFRRSKIGSASNCAACHRSAEKGDYSEDNVLIPR